MGIGANCKARRCIITRAPAPVSYEGSRQGHPYLAGKLVVHPKARLVRAGARRDKLRQRWHRLSVGVWATGAHIDDWACLRVIESRSDMPGPEV